MKRIIQDIKTLEFNNFYLLTGEEAYLRKQYRDNLKNALISPDDTMNCTVFSGKDFDANEFIDTACTMPFFAEKRVIIVENSGFFKAANENVNEGVKKIPNTTFVVFVEEEVDKRSKLYKWIGQNGYVATFDVQDELTLKKWIAGMLKKENKQITEQALDTLLDRTGTDMEAIKKEIEKLICYKLEDEGITQKDVEDLVTVKLQNKVFDMVDCVASKNQKEALNLYYDLLSLKEAPLKILALIARQFQMLLLVREMKSKGYKDEEIAAKTGLNIFYLRKKYIPQAAKFKLEQLKNNVSACVKAEEDVKMGRMTDILSVELIIISLSN